MAATWSDSEPESTSSFDEETHETTNLCLMALVDEVSERIAKALKATTFTADRNAQNDKVKRNINHSEVISKPPLLIDEIFEVLYDIIKWTKKST